MKDALFGDDPSMGCPWINELIQEFGSELSMWNWKFISAISGCLRFSVGELVVRTTVIVSLTAATVLALFMFCLVVFVLVLHGNRQKR